MAEPGSADGCISAVGVVMMVVMVKLCRQRWRHIDSEQNSVCIIHNIFFYFLFLLFSSQLTRSSSRGYTY